MSLEPRPGDCQNEKDIIIYDIKKRRPVEHYHLEIVFMYVLCKCKRYGYRATGESLTQTSLGLYDER